MIGGYLRRTVLIKFFPIFPRNSFITKIFLLKACIVRNSPEVWGYSGQQQIYERNNFFCSLILQVIFFKFTSSFILCQKRITKLFNELFISRIQILEISRN